MAASVVVATAGPAAAVTVTVTRFDDPTPGLCFPTDCSLREAVISANATPGLDTLILPGGTYELSGARDEDAAATGDLDITDDLEIQGAGVGDTIINPVNFGYEDRALHVHAGASLTVSGVSITGFRGLSGLGGGAILHEGDELLVASSSFANNHASATDFSAASGGAILALGTASVDIQGVAFTANTLGDSTNRGGVGGAIAIASEGQLDVIDSSFENNRAGDGSDFAWGGDGGAIATLGPARITATTFTGNSGGADDGENFIGGGGGAIYSGASALEVIDAVFLNNDAGQTSFSGGIGRSGGAVYSSSGQVTISRSAFMNNAASDARPAGGVDYQGGSGGAVFSGGPASIEESTFDGNSAGDGEFRGGRGGAVASNGLVVVTRSTFSNNEAGNGRLHPSFLNGGDGGDGGAIWSSSADITASTFTMNRAGDGAPGAAQGVGPSGDGGDGGDGGAIHSGDLTIVASTIVANDAGAGGAGGTGSPPGPDGSDGVGGGFLTTSTASMTHTIVASNAVSGVTGFDCSGTVTSTGYNLLSIINGCTFTATTGDQVGSFFPIDPLLASLADNGGATETILPLPGSPVLDAGVAGPGCGLDDQRGVTRPGGLACDIGAVEIAHGLEVLPEPCVIYSSQDATDPTLDGAMNGQEIRTVQVSGTLADQGGDASCVPDGASAAIMRVSSIDPLTEGNLRMTPSGVVATGGAGVVNYGENNGLNNTNTVTVPVSATGAVDIQANAGTANGVPIMAPTTDVRLVAIAYYIPTQSELLFTPLNPCAVVDSRPNKGADDTYDGPADDGFWTIGAFPDFIVTGIHPAGQGGGNGGGNPNGNPTKCGVPDGADAVLVNVVAIAPVDGGGHLAVGPGGSTPGDESVVGFAPLVPVVSGGFNNGATTIVPLKGAGNSLALQVYGDAGARVKVRVEVLGYFTQTAGLRYSAVTPCAVFDSRPNKGAGGDFAGERLHGATHSTTYQVSGDSIDLEQGGLIDSGAGVGSCEVPDGSSAALINFEAVNALQEGNFWVAAASATPGAATTGGVLNFNNVTPKMNNANAVVVPLNASGQIDLEINAGSFTADGTPITQVRGVVLGYYN